MDLGLANKVVLVTAGSGDGVGSAVARPYAAEGSRVAITYRSRPEIADKVAAEVEQPGGQALPVYYDLADHDSVREGTYVTLRSVAPVMKQRGGGRIVLVSSVPTGFW